MKHRSIRLVAAALLSAVALGCNDTDPFRIAPEDRFQVLPAFMGIDPGATQQMTATLGGAPVAVTWESSNPAVATVTAGGLVTGLTAGFTAVTAKITSDPTRLLSSSVNVLPLLGIGLTNGVALGPLASSGARGSSVLYRIFVPPGKTNLRVELGGGSGDADIYIRRATPPTLSSFTFFSENGGNGEIINIPNPATGTWYILVGLWDAYAGAFLTATHTP